MLGILLLTGHRLQIFAPAASLLLLTFFIIMVRSYAAGLGIDCGCFGVGEALGPQTLLGDRLLLAGSMALSVCAFVRLRSKPV